MDTIVYTPPYQNNVVFSINSGYSATGKFFVNCSDTPNDGDATRPNTVVNMGWNLSPGGGPVLNGEPFLGVGFESHYVPAQGTEFNEFHLYWGDKNGAQHRPISFRID